MAKNVEGAVEKIVAALLEGSNLDLVDVDYVKEKDWYLRVFIDKKGGIEIDDCQQLSEKLEEILDRDNVINEGYILEVSSPGLDRVLKKERDFEREQGKMVDVTLYASSKGSKLVTGRLTGYKAASKAIVLDDIQEIPLDKTAQVRLHIEF